MTGRTHDLAAFTGLNYLFISSPLKEISLATLVVALGANFIGGLAPDLDQPTSGLWERIRGGTLISRLLSPMLGAHRLISHSVLGIFLFGAGTSFILDNIGSVLLVDMGVVWVAFMVGFLSHLFVDLFTKEGLPLFFPIPVKIGIPPVSFLRLKTGGLVEKSLIFPGLMVLNFYLVFQNYEKYLDFLRLYVV